MLVRLAKTEDAAAIQALYQLLVPDDKNIKVDARRIETLATDPNNFLFVSEGERDVVGTAFLTICLDPMYGFQPYGVLENLIVAPAARGQGRGRALITAVELTARSAGCTKLMLLSTVSRTEAHAFFAAVGFDGAKKRGFIKYLNRHA
jgi:N-acetylglutamate synthase-like GNAT family acetyltransferase